MQILVIEDERRMAELLKRGLTEEGHQVIVARDGAVAVECAARLDQHIGDGGERFRVGNALDEARVGRELEAPFAAGDGRGEGEEQERRGRTHRTGM